MPQVGRKMPAKDRKFAARCPRVSQVATHGPHITRKLAGGGRNLTAIRPQVGRELAEMDAKSSAFGLDCAGSVPNPPMLTPSAAGGNHPEAG